MAPDEVEKDCCQRTREIWLKRIIDHYASFPVVKSVPCEECQAILEVRVYG